MPHLNRVAMRLTRHRENAEDLIQDFLIKAYAQRDKFSAMADARPWLTRVLYNLYVDGWRKQRSLPDVFCIEDCEEPSDEHSVSPLLELQQQQEWQLLATILDKLPDEQRVLVILHDLEDYTLAEINQITGIPIGTIKSRLHRARDRLRQGLQRHLRQQTLEVCL